MREGLRRKVEARAGPKPVPLPSEQGLFPKRGKDGETWGR